ncbi:MAG: lipopolysaccharide biosynthesis protein RfbH [Candidatus Omnitrophica bacterium]|nr:lipopolysaccharide biosynthesis protein RfbH [Candidatus Omnitrophota bacterium]
MVNKRNQKLKSDIFKKVRAFYKLENQPNRFIPGETKVNCSGRVYDEKEIISLVDSALEFWLTSGRFAREFEEGFCRFLKCKHTLLVNSGSSANLLAVTTLTSPELGKKRLEPGDEIITTAAAFPTTVSPIVQNQLVPVFLDVELPGYNINPKIVEKAVTKKTKAIFVAHTLGNPFDLTKIVKIAKKYGLFLIEDACDALGSKYKGRYVGTFGDIGTFSFYPAHHITMGEGGALVTNNDKLKVIIQSFRDWGRACWCEPGEDNCCGRRFEWKLGDLPYGYDHKYIYSHLGYNLKATDMQAAIGVEQLKKLGKFIRIRSRNFELLYAGLKKYEDYLILPKANPGALPSWFGFLISVKKGAGFSKNELVEYLEKNKIATRMLFAGNIIKQPVFKDIKYRVSGTLENTDFIMQSTFWIGVYPGINREMVNYILERFAHFFKNRL